MRERIKLLAGRFLQRCSGDVATLRALLTPMGTSDAKVFDARVFEELEHLAHRICGTGASLGFESLSTCAAAIERLAEGQAPMAAVDKEVVRRLVECVAALEHEVDRLIHASV
jgi:HPt (histidine-containing phosphotransfer) domain-containing protein